MQQLKELATAIRTAFNLTDEEREELEKEPSLEEEHQKMIAEFLKQNKRLEKVRWIDSGYRGVYFKDSRSEAIAKNGQKFIDTFETFFKPNNVGIYISGPVGTGKTFLAMMIANEMAELGYKIYMSRISNAIEDFNDIYDTTIAEKIKNREFDLIILDDFGASRETDYQIERLWNLIDAIKVSQTPLIVTTNLAYRELSSPETNLKLKRIYDRILEMCAFFPPIKGTSKRIQSAQELNRESMKMFDSNDDSD